MIRRLASLLLLFTLMLVLVYPVSAASEVEIVLVVDTSDTMAEELDVLCEALEDLMDDYPEANWVLVGITKKRLCTSDTVIRMLPESRVSHPEDWGVAVADLAANYAWGAGAVRLIIPLGDEGPYQGNPVQDPGDDRETIQDAIRLAKQNDVIVSPIVGDETEPEVEVLAQDLAEATGGRLAVIQNPDKDLIKGVRRLIDDVVGDVRAKKSLVERLPTPLEINLRGSALGANLVLAVLMTVLLGVATFILNSTLSANSDVFGHSRAGLMLAAALNLSDVAGRLLTPGEWSGMPPRLRRVLSGGEMAAFLLLTALLGAFLQPNFSLALFVGLTLATIVVISVYEGARRFVAQRLEIPLDVRIWPACLLFTFLCVLCSRLFAFRPGFFYGRPMGYGDAALRPDWAKLQRLVLVGLGAVLGVSLLFWGFSLFTYLAIDLVESVDFANALDKPLVSGLDVLQGFFLLVFFVGLEASFFEMLPLEMTNGGKLYRHYALLWYPAFAAVSFLLLHTLVNPDGVVFNLGKGPGLTLCLVALCLYSALALGVWLFFALLTGGEAGKSYAQSQSVTVLAISLALVWILYCLLVLIGLVARAVG